VELDWWQSMRHAGAEIVYTPAQHWSGRGIRGRNRTLWGGFVVTSDERSVYFAGDTGYAQRHFTAIRERCGPPHVALLPIGAYEPRWFMREQHMDPDDAVRAHRDLDARLSIATHFGCFQLTDEGIEDPVLELGDALRAHGVDAQRFRVLETGETLRVPA
jgi:L-ascorbate metabolism protein UlaG (beta-lactamase superfamily)